ncbi:MAG: hypothetical protein O2905_03510 [Proteobacteria bacterium]|nr:hypothetical protein [Pseudomonadota bacterium]MDA1132273.1 hypothetical protein [Pseudomonadota bacterium]
MNGVQSVRGGVMLTAFLPKGSALELVRLLHAEKRIDSGNVASGRGLGVAQSISYGDWGEVDILSLVVPHDRRHEIFEYLHERANIERFGGGILMMAKVERATEYALPEIQEES